MLVEPEDPRSSEMVDFCSMVTVAVDASAPTDEISLSLRAVSLIPLVAADVSATLVEATKDSGG